MRTASKGRCVKCGRKGGGESAKAKLRLFSKFGLPPERSMLLNAAIERVKSREYDPSHDYAHVLRVTLLSLRLAKSQNSKAGIQLDLQVVTLAALFHDLLDSKYLPAGQTFPSPRQFLAKFWLENDGKLIGRLDASGRVVAAQGTSNGSDAISDEQKRLVERIIDNVSYSKEIKEIPSEWTKECGELHWFVVEPYRNV